MQNKPDPRRILKHAILLFLLFMLACSHEKPLENRINFPTCSWPRYDILKFELPVTESGRSYDVVFEIRCRKTFAYDEFPMNMVLNTPSGEERIREFQIITRDKNGKLTGTVVGDTLISRFFLKKNLACAKKGMLKVEIENLNPRMATEGVFSASLILIQR